MTTAVKTGFRAFLVWYNDKLLRYKYTMAYTQTPIIYGIGDMIS